jgi:hypothetical protein
MLAASTGWSLLIAVAVFFTVCAVLVAVVAVFAIGKAEREEDDDWVDLLVGQRMYECVCGAQVGGAFCHHVSETFTDDARLGARVGQTGASADFCPEHCPGGCNRGCVVAS